MPICPNFPLVLICPKCPLVYVIFSDAHLSPLAPTPIGPKYPFFQMSICPSSPMPPMSQIAHLPPMPTCPKAHRSQSAHLPQIAHFPKCPFVPVFACFQCHLSQIGLPFDPNTHLPLLPNAHLLWCSFFLVAISPQCLSVPKCPFASIADLLWCSFFLVPISPKLPIFPQCPPAPMLIVSEVPIWFKVLICRK